ncbi:MAG: diaminopimelate decarboxylase [Leptospirales bacterium]|nr:diaminopimelate decarboxylase [Leptospirales bacterium]
MKIESFAYKNGSLEWQGASVRQLAAEYGTPLYVYSEAAILDRIARLRSAFGSRRAGIYYSVKANSNLSVLRIISGAGCGADIVSGGELFRCLKAGLTPEKIVFSGVGKSADEIRYAINTGILFLSVESPAELEAIGKIAQEMGKTARISVRVNPDVDPKTHPYISTGLKENKFGISHREVVSIYKLAASLPGIQPTGLGFHIGSQITDLSAFKEAGQIAVRLVNAVRAEGINLHHLDVGGGLGISYLDEKAPAPEEYARQIIDSVGLPDLELMFDPGRSIVGNSGILVSRLLYLKGAEAARDAKGASIQRADDANSPKTFYICDAGMNDLLRPSLYDAYHHVYSDPERPLSGFGDLVGPVCESGDFFAKDRAMPAFKAGDLAVLASAGAYGFTMASNYNSRPRPAEVLIRSDGRAEIVRKRESFEDLIRGE